MRSLFIDALIVSQAFVVLFIALHDWVPLGRLNDVPAAQAADPPGKLIRVTVFSTAPFAFALGATMLHARSSFPGWLTWTLWVIYGAALYGLIRAWWGPYLLFEEPARALRYQAMFGRTHAFLPMRHGIRPNTLHVGFHVVVVIVVVLLGLMPRYVGA